MTAVLLVDDSLRDDIHNSMIMIATTLGLVASSMIGGGLFLMIQGLRKCSPPEPCPPCVPYEASCSTRCTSCPTTCKTTCYTCQTGKSKSVASVSATSDTVVDSPADVTVQIA